ncbi:MAG: ribonuclease P protein subunit [Candidatus Diapherotrites archaeon]|nr:ribonuclease P protein subunit [Candidatus Diapherotrites archaeon]
MAKNKALVKEIIGLKAKVLESTDKGRVGLTGVIIDETKNTLIIENKGEKKVLPKAEIVIEVEDCGEKIILDCRKMLFRPEDRIKRCWGE